MIKINNNIVYLIYQSEKDLFIIEDIIEGWLKLFEYHSSFLIDALFDNSHGINHYLYKSWFSVFAKELFSLKKKEEYSSIINNLKVLLKAIGYAVRDYQIKNHINSMLTSREYDRYYLEKYKPFPIYVDEDNNIHLEMPLDYFKTLQWDALLFKSFCEKDEDKTINLLSEIFIIDNKTNPLPLKQIFTFNEVSDFYLKKENIIKELLQNDLFYR